MKRFALLLLATCALAIFAAPAEAQEWVDRLAPADTLQLEFGEIERGTPVQRTLRFTNPYRETLHIDRLSYDAREVSEVTASRETIGPGETCEITLVVKTERRPGSIESELRVRFDAPFRGTLTYRLRGAVVDDYYLEPGSIEFGEVAKGTHGVQEICVFYYEDLDWQVEAACSSEHLEMRLERGGNPEFVRYEITVILSDEAPLGLFEEEITLRAIEGDAPPITIPVTGEVREILKPSTEEVNLGPVPPGYTRSFRVSIWGSSTYAIRRIEAEDPQFQVLHDQTAGQNQSLTVNFTAGDEPGPFTAEITIYTNLNDLTVTVPIRGEILPPESTEE